MNTETAHVMEIVTFRLKADADPVAFRTAAKGLDRLLHSRGTAVSRALVVDDDDVWTDIIQWTSMEEAKAAAEELVKDPAFAPVGAMIDESSVKMRHAPVLHQME
jgi:hypothetical protein